jgi:hypothetical protein
MRHLLSAIIVNITLPVLRLDGSRPLPQLVAGCVTRSPAEQ